MNMVYNLLLQGNTYVYGSRRREDLPPIPDGHSAIPRMQMQPLDAPPLTGMPPATPASDDDAKAAQAEADDLLRRVQEKINDT